ncbi:GNAT family N-acetyltransferase [Alistipes finegoldii]|uniref:GNAT family N-acetyltransferase n=1 Tax=Alistipes finegoldii TaxID=214856 RepID=UPI00325B8BBA
MLSPAGHRPRLVQRLRDFCRTDPAVSRITVNSSPYAVEIYRRLGFTATDAERVTDGIRFTPMTYLL